jgi:hypothetical protein
VNPKNLMLNLGAMASVAEAGLPATQQAVDWLLLHNSAVMTVLLLIFGVVLARQGWQQLA